MEVRKPRLGSLATDALFWFCSTPSPSLLLCVYFLTPVLVRGFARVWNVTADVSGLKLPRERCRAAGFALTVPTVRELGESVWVLQNHSLP